MRSATNDKPPSGSPVTDQDRESTRTRELLDESETVAAQSATIKAEAETALHSLIDALDTLRRTTIDLAELIQVRRRD